MMNTISFRRNIERQWTNLRNDINKLADTFDLPGLEGGGWTGGGGFPGGGQGNVPTWATGTFYARNPQTGGTIQMDVARNGSVTISFDGGPPVYASMNRTTLTNGQYVSRVTRLTNGIRTTDVTNGSYIDYYRTPIIGGGGGQQGNVPSWAQGTFYARNPQTGGTIEMNVARNGNVTLIFDGGAPVYASMNRTTLTNGPYVSRVTRLNNGIRTTDVTNGSYIDYYRTPIIGGGGGVGQGDVPNWAVGTFYARNPQTGGTIQMTILRNGSVTIVFDGGAPVYASMNGTTLTNGPYVSRVTRLNNGIRTTDTSNGSYIDYYRR
jgi:hypothetical protein